MWQYNYADELYHVGVLGMRWGVRRGRRQLSKLTGRDKKSISDKEASDFRNDVKYVKKHGIRIAYKAVKGARGITVTQFYNSRNQKIGKEYASKIMAQSNKEKNAAIIAGGMIGIGAAAALNILSRIE